MLSFHKLREVIFEYLAAEAHELLSSEIEVDESYFCGTRKGKRGRGAAGKVSVFGLLKRNGRVDTAIIPNVSSTTLFPVIRDKIKPNPHLFNPLISFHGRCCYTCNAVSGKSNNLVPAVFLHKPEIEFEFAVLIAVLKRKKRNIIEQVSLKYLRYNGDSDAIRTHGPQIRNLVLYPAELRNRQKSK